MVEWADGPSAPAEWKLIGEVRRAAAPLEGGKATRCDALEGDAEGEKRNGWGRGGSSSSSRQQRRRRPAVGGLATHGQRLRAAHGQQQQQTWNGERVARCAPAASPSDGGGGGRCSSIHLAALRFTSLRCAALRCLPFFLFAASVCRSVRCCVNAICSSLVAALGRTAPCC